MIVNATIYHRSGAISSFPIKTNDVCAKHEMEENIKKGFNESGLTDKVTKCIIHL